MDAYMGIWKSGDSTNTEEFMKVYGVPEDQIKEMENSFSYTMEYTKKGDNCMVVQCVILTPSGYPPKTYEIVPGTPTTIEGMFGETVEYCLKFEGGKILEEYEDKKKNRKWSGETVINGDEMIIYTTLEGVSMSMKYQKC